MKFRKKPIVIEAFQWLGEDVPGFERKVDENPLTGEYDGYELLIPTLEGLMVASVGDYIITGIKNEVYPCKPDIFEATYERVEE